MRCAAVLLLVALVCRIGVFAQDGPPPPSQEAVREWLAEHAAHVPEPQPAPQAKPDAQPEEVAQPEAQPEAAQPEEVAQPETQPEEVAQPEEVVQEVAPLKPKHGSSKVTFATAKPIQHLGHKATDPHPQQPAALVPASAPAPLDDPLTDPPVADKAAVDAPAMDEAAVDEAAAGTTGGGAVDTAPPAPAPPAPKSKTTMVVVRGHTASRSTSADGYQHTSHALSLPKNARLTRGAVLIH